MKVAQISKYGGSEVIEVRSDAEKPALKPGQVLVEIHAVSLNPVDYKIRLGYFQQMVPLDFPATLGGDFAGVVASVSKDVGDFKTGDEVFGSAIILNGGSGSLAQFAAANTKNISLKPKSVDHIQAASLTLVGASAIQAIEEHIKLSDGQRILIHGGAGGIGSIAIQLAKLHGAYVVTTVGGDDIEFVKKLGADQIIDYRSQNFESMVKDLDAVFDTVGGEVTTKSFQVLKKGGILVSMLGQPDEELAKQYKVTAIGQNTNTSAEKLKRLAELVDSGKMHPQVDKVFPLDQIREAFDYLENGHPRGKVVINL